MKLSITSIVAALAVTIIAQDLSDGFTEIEERDSLGTPKACDKYYNMLPKCTVPFINKCTKKAGCKVGDYACGCKKEQKIKKCAAGNVASKCGVNKGLKAQSAGEAICKCVKKHG